MSDPAVNPWAWFVDDMLELFGRRDPECVWCGKTVFMALQGPRSGGIWTTEEADEGPCSSGLDGPGTRCPESPDGEHSCFATEAWREAQ
jgi:ribosomal protein S27AE